MPVTIFYESDEEFKCQVDTETSCESNVYNSMKRLTWVQEHHKSSVRTVLTGKKLKISEHHN